MAGINHQDFIFVGCLLLGVLLVCPRVCTACTLCQQNCTCETHPLPLDNSELKGSCTCPRFGIVPEDILQNILLLELDYSQPVVLTNETIQKFHRIKQLNISGMQFVQPGGFQGLETLYRLILHHNFMRVLETAMFTDLRELTSLKVEGTTKNKIHALENGTFLGLTELKHLYLKGNAITVIVEEHLRDLESLNTLDLSSNRLSQIKANTFINAPSLTKLILSNNLITEIHRHAFIGLMSLDKLSLDGNQIKGMPRPVHVSGVPNARPFIVSLYNNPLRCDCHLNWISSWLENAPHGSCVTPSKFSDQSLEHVYKDGLQQCRPNNTVMTVEPGKQLELTCSFAGASWMTPGGRRFQEHGDCEDPFCLTNSDSLVIWKTSPELSGNYTCLSSDGIQDYYYQVYVKESSPSLTVAMSAGIAAGGFLVMVMFIVIGFKLRPNPPPPPLVTPPIVTPPIVTPPIVTPPLVTPPTNPPRPADDIDANGTDRDPLLPSDHDQVLQGAVNYRDSTRILDKSALSIKHNINVFPNNSICK